ncbi:MAG: DMT family transporter [Gammaproteobacteria bacterium]|nr:DMT family transporter [Gammaproteobacteria bacterium]
MPTKSDNRAIIALLLSATLWGLIWFPLRYLEQQGITGLWSSLIIYGALIPVGLFMARKSWRQLPQYPLALLWIGLASGWCNVAFIVAVIEGNVVRVLLLFYLSPVWATLIAWIHLDERPHLPAAMTVVVAMAGALIMLWEPSLGRPWPRETSDWIALSSGLAFAMANVGIRATPALSLNMKMMANWLGVSAVALVWILLIADPVPQVPASIWLLTVALGVVMLVMTLTVQYGVTHMPLYRSSVILLFELVAGAVSAQLLTDEVIQPREFLGGALIIMAAWASARTHHQ